jgi:hypothetical protein
MRLLINTDGVQFRVASPAKPKPDYKDKDQQATTRCCPALKMPTIRALGMPMAGNHNAPPVGAAGRCGR